MPEAHEGVQPGTSSRPGEMGVLLQLALRVRVSSKQRYQPMQRPWGWRKWGKFEDLRCGRGRDEGEWGER